jgi:hypothetical protein
MELRFGSPKPNLLSAEGLSTAEESGREGIGGQGLLKQPVERHSAGMRDAGRHDFARRVRKSIFAHRDAEVGELG